MTSSSGPEILSPWIILKTCLHVVPGYPEFFWISLVSSQNPGITLLAQGSSIPRPGSDCFLSWDHRLVSPHFMTVEIFWEKNTIFLYIPLETYSSLPLGSSIFHLEGWDIIIICYIIYILCYVPPIWRKKQCSIYKML